MDECLHHLSSKSLHPASNRNKGRAWQPKLRWNSGILRERGSAGEKEERLQDPEALLKFLLNHSIFINLFFHWKFHSVIHITFGPLPNSSYIYAYSLHMQLSVVLFFSIFFFKLSWSSKCCTHILGYVCFTEMWSIYKLSGNGCYYCMIRWS